MGSVYRSASYEIARIDESSNSFHIICQGIPCRVSLEIPSCIHLSILWTSALAKDRSALVQVVNKINEEYDLVRATIVPDRGILLDYAIFASPRSSLKGLLGATEWFALISDEVGSRHQELGF